MTTIWLSPVLSADRDALAALLGPTHELLPPSDLPPPGAVAVVSADERELLAAFGSRPPGVSLPLVVPPGATTADVAELVGRSAPAGSVPAGSGAAGWAPPPARGGRNRTQVLAAAFVGVAILIAAILVVTTGGGGATAAANTSGAQAGGPAGAGGEGGFGGQGGFGEGGAEGGFGGGVPGEGGAGGAARTLSSTQIKALVACLKKNGVTVTTNGNSLPRLDLSNAATAKAMRACASTAGLAAGGPPAA